MNDEVFNEALLIEVDDYQSQRENVMRNFLSNNIKSVPFSDHLDQSKNEYRVGILTRYQGMNMEIIRYQASNMGPRGEYGKIQEEL